MAATAALQRYQQSVLEQQMAENPPTVAERILDAVYSPLENAFAIIGLADPTMRFAVVTISTAAAIYFFKPMLFFVNASTGDKPQIVPKRWSFLEGDSELKRKNPQLYTAVPWWLAAIGAGAAVSLLI